jgi:uncharacterized Zn-binding protein involved in type VI secretion
MGQPAAKQGDQITATDTHIAIVPGSPPTASPVSLPFTGMIDGNLSTNVNIMGQPAATLDSTATNTPLHSPPPGTSFPLPAPRNQGTIKVGSATVLINGKPAARNGDMAETCNDPVDLPVGQVVAVGTVLMG